MIYKRLGNSGLKVSALSLGSWLTFGKQISDATAKTLMRTAYNKGINFFDNAEIYANGKSELVMGKIFKQMKWKRDTFIVSSKVLQSGDLPSQKGLNRKHITDACNSSLKRLQIDYIDIYFCHRPDPETPILETVQAMNSLIQRGQILYWGTSEWSPSQIIEAYNVSKNYNLIPPTTEQSQYNLIERANVEKKLKTLCDSYGLGLITYSPLFSGLLTGKYFNNSVNNTRLKFEELKPLKDLISNKDGKELLRKIKFVAELADEVGISMAQLSIAWCLKNPNVNSVILGASSEDQIKENIHTINILDKVDENTMKQIEDIYNYD